MATLTEEVKTFIVNELACFRRPQEIADLVKAEFNIEIKRQQVQTYDPERAGEKPAEKWCVLFEATRKAFVEGRAQQAVRHRTWRLRELEDMARLAKKSKNYKLAAELLKQAAEEDGDVYTNRHANAPSAIDDETRAVIIRKQLEAMDAQTVGTGPSPHAASPAAPALSVVRSA